MPVTGAVRSRPVATIRREIYHASRTQSWLSPSQQVRHGSMASMNRAVGKSSNRPQKSGGGETNYAGLDDIRWQIVMPNIFIRPPVARFPRSPRFAYAYVRSKVVDMLGRVGSVFSSKPTIFKGARLQQNKKSLIPTAKGLHRAMYEALARGDTTVLKRVCGEHLSARFTAAISARKPGRRYGWELVKYNHTMFYPRVMDNKIVQMAEDKKAGVTKPPIVRQVVVGIASKQRRWEIDVARGGYEAVVPGSEKTADVVEYVAMNVAIDRETWKQGEWKIIATLGETTPEKWAANVELMKEIESMS